MHYGRIPHLTLAMLLGVGLAACGPPPQPTEWTDEGTYRWRELAVPTRGGVGFTSLSARRTGIEFENSADSEEAIRNHNLMLGSGVALGDVDGDGRIDVYLARTEGSNVLYRNLGDFRFEDITVTAGVAAPDRYSTGATFADVDSDGDLDLLATALGGPNTLFLNDGGGRFEDGTEAAGLTSDRGSTTSTFADVDGDGDLDLYISNYKLVNATDLFTDQQLTFDNAVQQIGPEDFEIVPGMQEHYRFERVDGEWERTELADPDWFYLNDGTGRFEAVPFTAGRFLDERGAPLTRPPQLFGLAARFYDIDGDGDPDLYVCNDFEHPDLFLLNDGTGNFQAAPTTAIRTMSNASMGVDFADLDRDGDVDFYVVDMMSRDRRGRQMRSLAHRPLRKRLGVVDDQPQWQRNTLFLNRGDATFSQIAEMARVDASDWSWTPVFVDVDLDGYEDLLVTNGYSWDRYDVDHLNDLRRQFPRMTWRERRLLFPPLHQRNVAFHNRGDLTFDDVGERWGFGTEEDISHGLALGDLDGDGDLDVVVNRLGFPAAVLRNDATRGRVAVRLIGEAPNTAGIGSKIHVRGGPVEDQQKEVTSGGLYVSSSDPLQVFATGDSEQVDIIVDWRGGGRTEIRGARPNRLYEIRERGEPAPAPPDQPDTPLFTDVSALLDHRHQETEFDDFQRQPLLSHQLSLLGPGMTWYDVDGDGDEDLLMTAGRGGSLALYRNDGQSFTRVTLGPDSLSFDLTTVLGVPNGRGGSTLLVGQSSYEAESPDAALAAAAVLRLDPSRAPISEASTAVSTTVSAAVPPQQSSTGPLAVADYDGDGDLDLFVGGRMIPAAYPVPARSGLYLQEAGDFILDDGNAELLTAIGLVSSAVFSDIDSDGDPDLLLALDWGPVKVLLNESGRFRDATDAWGLAPFTSRWNGLASGDLNGDGLPDLVATSWGRNTRYRLRGDQPLVAIFGDLDGAGPFDILEATYDDRLGDFAPVVDRSFVELSLPAIAQRVRTYAAFADATVSELLAQSTGPSFRSEARSLDHMVFLNRGGDFEARPLPLEAQFAPAFYTGITDFDGDGHEDVFLTQNFFPTGPLTPPLDGGRGLLLVGDGTGGLVPVPGQQSGIMVYGDQRGAAFADYDGDGRTDLVVSQNGAATKLFRNVGAEPGLRVRLVGPPGNPHAIGAAIRAVYGSRRGPIREIQAGSGYWSSNGPVQVFSRSETLTAVWVRWPGGRESESGVTASELEVTVRYPN